MSTKSIKLALMGACLAAVLASCGEQQSADVAPGAPGAPSTWAFSGKTGIGTSYEAYGTKGYSGDAATGAVSNLWFSLSQGVLTETMYGLIHEAQIKDLEFALKGSDFLDFERTDMESEIDYLHKDAQGRPLSLAYRIVNRDRDGRYEIEKHIFTDPDRASLYLKVIVRSADGAVVPHLLLNPHINNTGGGDQAAIHGDVLTAWEGDSYLSLVSATPFDKASAGFVGASDGRADLADNGQMDWSYASTGDDAGNVALSASLGEVKGEQTYHFVVGFGANAAESEANARTTLAQGYEETLARYNGAGEHVGWEDYLAGLEALPKIRDMAMDGGKLAHVSALVLKAQEDKTHAGALIASLSNPWGDSVSAENSATGYKAVWPRDFYQCAMALLALGDVETPLAAFNYLKTIQVREGMEGVTGATGWFLQKTHVDGEREWVSVQLDQTAMPIMLGWKLLDGGHLDAEQAAYWYQEMLKPAAEFLVQGGKLGLDWNTETITPPWTQQERWEEQPGYSPSTTAAVVAGLISAANIADRTGDKEGAARYRAAAKSYSEQIEARMFTTTGSHGDGRYYVRITQNEDPNDKGQIIARNGRPEMDEDLILDAGFLELVRYGVRPADDRHILESLAELDDGALEDLLRVKYVFTDDEGNSFPGWRRYGNDGYGENTVDGSGYDGGESKTLRGRVWPFFTGERGHFELARAATDGELSAEELEALRRTYIGGMEYFANAGLMLPEQVWDGVGGNETYDFKPGEGTNSATPLAWTHAEYVKLLRSLSEGQAWDFYPNVHKELQGQE